MEHLGRVFRNSVQSRERRAINKQCKRRKTKQLHSAIVSLAPRTAQSKSTKVGTTLAANNHAHVTCFMQTKVMGRRPSTYSSKCMGPRAGVFSIVRPEYSP